MVGPLEALRRARRSTESATRTPARPSGDAGGRGVDALSASPIGEAPDRTLVRLHGNLRTVTLRPRGGVPALEAELHDGTGGVALVWLGRRRIEGISPGRALAVEGRIGRTDKVRVIYNPRYELMP